MRTYRSVWIVLLLAVVIVALVPTGVALAFEHDGWRAGHWFHGEHLGRLGWWWVVGDGWYFYPAPLYPYPDPYIPPAVVPSSADHWYYCPSARAYYPYVTECPEGWKPVLPQAPQS